MAKKRKDMTVTVDELWRMCVEQRKAGNGKKKILISDDDEGNGFHHLFFGMRQAQEPNDPLDFFTAAYIDKPSGVTDENVHEYMILG